MTEVNPARIGVTGTPGTGKSSLCKLASSSISVADLAADAGALGEVNTSDSAAPIDIDLLREHLAGEWAHAPPENILVDGHLSHLLPIDAVVILRCDPRILTERMEARGWSERKVAENAEWELLGGAWNEHEEWVGVPTLELESTDDSSKTLYKSLCAWIGVGFKPTSPERQIDWVERIHG